MQRQQQLQAEYLFTQAQISFQEGAFNVSLAHIEQGLLAAPDHPGLLSLREQVKTRKAELGQQAEQAKRQQEEEAARQQAEQAKRQQEEEAARQQAEQVKRQQEEEARQQAKTVEPTRRPAEPASRQTPAVAKPNPAKPVRSPTIPEEKRKPTIAETGASKVKQSSRCENILSRITLGEAVSSADQIFMTKECR
ncbi:MAG: Non-specific serine/threonine protein kinase [Pseudomonadota bacterium]|nr:Non-specific serine/threonine protein kinase [Pseudomonadota bacterium]